MKIEQGREKEVTFEELTPIERDPNAKKGGISVWGLNFEDSFYCKWKGQSIIMNKSLHNIQEEELKVEFMVVRTAKKKKKKTKMKKKKNKKKERQREKEEEKEAKRGFLAIRIWQHGLV